MNTEDRELFELAAKAAGIERGGDRFDCGISITLPCGRHKGLPKWNPLQDDGDAFRLAVILGLRLQFFSLEAVDDVPGKTVCSVSWVPGGEKNRIEEYLLASDADPIAAARRAVFQAAVEIGRRMK